ncbi:hypothetical protein NHP190003_14640 [Helicobacter sp. NHP19-003]|uniref:Uncharacterized protein n=1 Tax=Helicobacter gastrocanis TaxID=2849641 RepID=A0ABN6I3K1_9HELI|nr:hypothetical protein NHP190003_14640 [Helicobacter sp. NHP19-003]
MHQSTQTNLLKIKSKFYPKKINGHDTPKKRPAQANTMCLPVTKQALHAHMGLEATTRPKAQATHPNTPHAFANAP